MTNKTKIQRIRENDMAGRIDLSLVSMDKPLIDSYLRASNKFKALNSEQQHLLLAKLYETVQLAMIAVILENLDPENDKSQVQLFIQQKNYDGLWLYAVDKIPNIENKLEPTIKRIANDLMKEL